MASCTALEVGSHCVAAVWLADAAYFAFADGTVHRWNGEHSSSRPHDGLLAASPTPERNALLTGGEDGRVCRMAVGAAAIEIASVPRKWINALAAGREGRFAFAAGRSVWVGDGIGAPREFQHSTAVEHLAFAPDGSQFAVAGANGIALHSLRDGEPRRFEWQGLHTAVAFSPDRRFIVGPLREGGFHGWRIEDAQHLRMLGYRGKVADWSWSADGSWLATSGAVAVILWPFEGWDGPIGKAPFEIGEGSALVTAVACHPADGVVAVGRDDGTVEAIRFNNGVALRLDAPSGSRVTALGWDWAGRRLAFGTELGRCGIAELEGTGA